jgi:catalase
MSAIEQQHIVDAFSFELAKVERPEIRERVVETMLSHIDADLTARVCDKIGLKAPAKSPPEASKAIVPSPALSQIVAKATGDIKARKIAVLVADGVDTAGILQLRTALEAKGATVMTLAEKLGPVKGLNGDALIVDKRLITMPSLAFDAVILPDGAEAVTTLLAIGDVRQFVAEAYKHSKAIAAIGDGAKILDAVGISVQAPGIVTSDADGEAAADFADAISLHRAWGRTDLSLIAG